MARLRNALLAGLVFAFLLREGSPPVLAQSSILGSRFRLLSIPFIRTASQTLGLIPSGKSL